MARRLKETILEQRYGELGLPLCGTEQQLFAWLSQRDVENK
jgi:hypothetical protein